MSERVFTDQQEVITVALEGVKVDSVSIRNSWRSYYPSPAQLSGVLTQLVVRALPPLPEERAVDAVEPVVGYMSNQQLVGFWREFSLWRQKMKELRQRAVAGERIVPDPLTEAHDVRERVFVGYTAGRVDTVALRPDWVERAALQELNDVVSDFLRGIDLVQEPRPPSEVDEVTEHLWAARRYLR